MSDLQERSLPVPNAIAADAVDEGLRAYMLGIYNKVGLGLVAAAAAAYATAEIPVLRDLMFTRASAGAPQHLTLTLPGAVVAFAPMMLLVFSGPVLAKPTPSRTAALYWAVVGLVGASLGALVLSFTGRSIVMTLAVSALGFGALSLAGYRTRRDLTALGSFLITGLVGLVVALAANLVLRSPALDFVASCSGVLIFAGLIAFDTQRLKLTYQQFAGDRASQAVATNLGALSLFINFVNLFQILLMTVSGQRR